MAKRHAVAWRVRGWSEMPRPWWRLIDVVNIAKDMYTHGAAVRSPCRPSRSSCYTRAALGYGITSAKRRRSSAICCVRLSPKLRYWSSNAAIARWSLSCSVISSDGTDRFPCFTTTCHAL